MGMIQFTYYKEKGRETYGLTTFVEFSENSGVYRCNSVDCFMRYNDVASFNTPQDAEKFCVKVATSLKKMYDKNPDELVSDIKFYGEL